MQIFTHFFKYGAIATVKRIIRELAAFKHFRNRLIPYSVNDSLGIGEDFIYCPHPFTNWSLNPGYRDANGEKIHTVEGFRKTAGHDSVFDCDPKKHTIYCMGGSTTYCVELLGIDKPWPSKLGKKLDCNVVNAGVGGWSTLQSLIRLISWATVLKPTMIIVYQSKNDLTPLYNGNLSETKVYPDYSNLMGQFSHGVSGLKSPWISKQNNGGVGCVYGSLVASFKGFERFDATMLLSVQFRYEMVCAIAKRLNADVIFVPEIIRKGPYVSYVQKIHEVMREVAKWHDYLVLDVTVPDKYFFDQMHFNEEGCEYFADVLGGHILNV